MKNKWYGDDFKLGVVGGGQLGRMMIQEAINLDIQIHCLDPDPNAPCAKIASTFTVGSLNDYDTLYAFGKDKDVITVEIENVNIEALKKLESEGKRVFPQPHVLEIIKDKGVQKEFYKTHSLPTAPFELKDENFRLTEKDLPVVQKLRTGGYDGKGVQVIKTTGDLTDQFNAPCVLEELIPFEKEISVIVARNENGEVASFPAVECYFNPKANLVELLFCPSKIDAETEESAQLLARQVIEKLEMVGLLAVEMFLSKNGDLLINEIAPRPHNSGHHTIECNETSQFMQHIRAILNLPLGSTKATRAGAMINLLGEPNYEGKVKYEGLEEAISMEGVHPHIYGKSSTKSFRKMGHVTLTGDTIEEVLQKAEKVKKMIKVIA
ncbi:MAG: 5-(carboxyamino)imidazole ribonucleotide synthase [Bacteroidetes bacterium]|nr:MAG: 5-(carboxyamino)imidazole ribonucleotide synthase [Bacteroidota bacterium]